MKRILNTFQAWWYGLRARTAALIVADAPAPTRKIPPIHLAMTQADRLDWLVLRYKATYHIYRFNDGVLVTLSRKDFSTVSSGVQPSLGRAIDVLKTKCEQTWN